MTENPAKFIGANAFARGCMRLQAGWSFTTENGLSIRQLLSVFDFGRGGDLEEDVRQARQADSTMSSDATCGLP